VQNVLQLMLPRAKYEGCVHCMALQTTVISTIVYSLDVTNIKYAHAFNSYVCF